MKGRFVFVDPPSPPGFISFKHSHAGFGEFCKDSRLRLPTLDLFHCASLLAERGFAVGVVDSPLLGHGPAGCVAEVLARKPGAVAIRTGGFSLPLDLEVARRLRRSFDGPILLFGPAAAAEPKTILESGAADAVVAGEAPAAFLAIAGAKSLGKAPGVLTLDGAGRVVEGPRPRVPESMDYLPVPAWDLVPYRRYSFVTSQTAWGCPMACGYCPYPLAQGARPRRRSAGSVAREFSALRSRFGLRFVQLRDPDFALDRRRTAGLCRALTRAGAPMTWGCETRLERLDDELMALMAAAGCLRVAFGVESLEPAVLRLMGREHPGPAFIRGQVSRLKRHGILTYGLYMIGLPGETRKSTLGLIDFAVGLDTEAASFSMAMPIPGTALERLARSKGWITAPGPWRLTSCVPSMRNEHMDIGEVSELHLLAKRRWKNRLMKRRRPPRYSPPPSGGRVI
ncbi:MAG: radical SAM protein [Elusimicrobia bacterium]|nr:radical SAM protein [Elusimicrobiota bacterium]